MAQWRAVMDLPASPAAPGMARTLVAGLVRGWGLAEIVDDAMLVASELVSNAYLHAPGTDSFELELARLGNGVQISLADGSSIQPIIRELSHEAPHGRGMHIVEALATRWGAEDHHGGKRIWVRLDRPERDGGRDKLRAADHAAAPARYHPVVARSDTASRDTASRSAGASANT